MSQPSPIDRYRRVQKIADAALERSLENTAREIRRRVASLDLRPGVGAKIRAAQLRLVLRQIELEQMKFWTDELLAQTMAGREAGAKAAQDAIDAMNKLLFGAMDPDAAEILSDSLEATARAGIEADMARVPRELSKSVYRNASLANGRVEEMIKAGIRSGLSAKELAASVYKYISPTVPGGQSYAAMRLARNEINNAFHEQQKKGGLGPGVKGTKWNLSNSHPKPDDCDKFAKEDTADLGVGVFPANSVPNKPHPHCFCYLTYVTVSPDEFAKLMKSGAYNDEISKRTKANLERQGAIEKPYVSKRRAKEEAPPTPAATPYVSKRAKKTEAPAPAPETPYVSKRRKATTPPERNPLDENPFYDPASARGAGADRGLTRPVKIKKGKDETQWVEQNATSFHHRQGPKAKSAIDEALTKMADRQGWHELPGVGSKADLDAKVKEGWTELYRGIRPYKDKTAPELLSRLRGKGDWEIGTGIYGNGVYFSTERATAEAFATSFDGLVENGTIRMALSPNAKIVDYHKLLDEQRQWISDYMKSTVNNTDRARVQAMIDTMSDPGRFAAARGYDVIKVVGEHDGRAIVDQYVILNRTVMLLEDLP